MTQAEEQGAISSDDARSAGEFIGLSGTSSVNIYIMARTGKLTHLEGHEGFQATIRVLEAIGLGNAVFDHTSAEPVEDQFWNQFDGIFELSENEMRK